MKFTWMASLALTFTTAAMALDVPVAKDASLIRSSLCCGPGAADRNFGAAETVDSGRYHHDARALLGFDLTGVPMGDQVWLVLPGSTVGSGSPDFTLHLVRAPWDESTVTFNSAPAGEPLVMAGTWVDHELRFDVTETVNAALQNQASELSFVVEATGSTNLFIPSRENKAGRPAARLDVVIP